MTTQTIAILEPGYASYETERKVLGDQDVRIAPISIGEDAVPALQALDPVAIMVRESTVGCAEIDACPNLKVIARYGVGVDNVDLEYAKSGGIYVANVPDYGAEIEVSEQAVALYLAVQRRIPSRDAEVRSGVWGIGQAAMIPGRQNATLGLIGCGRIGLETARKFRPFGFNRVLAFDPFLSTEAATDANIELADLYTLCTQADVVSLHAPLTPVSHHILNRSLIARMKPNAVVVNVSRGGLVDEVALASALDEGRIFGAGIDVFEHEPVDLDNPLLSSPNTIVSDHCAWYSERSVAVLQKNAAEEVRLALTGHSPENWVNPW